MSTWNKVKPSLIITAVGSIIIILINVTKPTPTPSDNEDIETHYAQVQVKLAQPEQVTLSVLSQGSVAPKRTIDLITQVSGIITSVENSFQDGAYFSANTSLIYIDEKDYEAALLNAQGLYAQAKRALAEERGKSLQAKRQWRELGDDASNNLFLRKPHLAEAEAQFTSAKASLETAKRNLEKTRITAPFDGRIITTSADLGQFVSAGTTVARVYDTAVAEIRIPLSDRQIANLDLPLAANPDKNINQPKVTLRGIIAGKSHQWSGHITRTEGAIDINSRMYYAIVEVENAFTLADNNAPMIPGLFVNAEIAGKTRNDVIKIPSSALVKRHYIYTLSDTDHVELTPVNVLHKTDSEAWITAQISKTVRIVLEKQALLTKGTQVTAELISNTSHTLIEPEAAEVPTSENNTHVAQEHS